MPPCGVRCEGWGILCRNTGVSSPRSTCWLVLQNLFTEEPNLWIPRLSPDGLWREARRAILGDLPVKALLLQPAQTAPLSRAGRKERFLFVNSSYALRPSFLPPLPSSPKALPPLAGDEIWPSVLGQRKAGPSSPTSLG